RVGGAFMIIAVDVRPEVEAELARQAALRGSPIEAYAAVLLEEAVHIPAHPAPVARNMVELFAPLRGLNLNFERDKDPGRDLEL
ncbi:MAG: hypothetical protein ABUS51_08885, partial [Acidobacteriota bacterium]